MIEKGVKTLVTLFFAACVALGRFPFDICPEHITGNKSKPLAK